MQFLPVLAQEELKICVLRVEFQPDENTLTTGNGQFILDKSDVSSYTVDPPPHNRSYFQDQILAVHNYYMAASKGKLSISGRIFPLNDDSAYILPEEMGYYNPNTTATENNNRLAQLFVEIITLADNDPDITFADYNLIAIFHAGVGKDIDLGFDETPQDIPSIYFTSDFLKKSLGNDFDGVIVDNGTFKVDQAALLPETESQAEFELGLTGIFAANIGSYLGMYDLFSPSTQKSGVGIFGLMDSGLFNMFGLSPSMPSAISRLRMGWENPVSLEAPQETITLSRFEGMRSKDNTLYKIPINSNEYYLVEYRGERNIKVDSVFSKLAEGRDDLPTYLEVLTTYIPDRIKISDSTGVLLNVDNYDWGLPGAGILIWHIDNLVIAQNSASNTINDDMNNRAVDLEEADGSQDIGYSYTLVEPGYQSELGTWLDFWFAGNPSPLYKNEFSSTSSPNTRANRTYAKSHINLHDFSDNFGSTMTFSYDRDFFEEGFPVKLETSLNNRESENPLIVPIDFEDKVSLFVPDNKGQIWAVSAQGKGILYPKILKAAQFQKQEQCQLALIDSDNNQKADILLATGVSGTINAFIFSDVDLDSMMDTLFTHDLDKKIIAAPVIQNPYIYIATEPGEIYRFTIEGKIDSSYSFQDSLSNFTVLSPQDIRFSTKSPESPAYPPVVVDLNGDEQYEQVIVTAYDQISIQSGEQQQTVDLPGKIVGPPAFADIDADGYYEIFFNLSNLIYGIKYNGSLVSNMPFIPELLPEESLVGTPLILDVNGDNNLDIIAVTSAGQLFAYTREGIAVEGFPFSQGGAVSLSALVGDIDGDNLLELMALNDNGEVFAWQLDSAVDENLIWWYQSSFDFTNNHFIPKILKSVDESGLDLLPSERVYNYPNPNSGNYTKIRYYLREDATVNVKIFDLAGDMVTSFSGPGIGKIDHEIQWDLSNVASGIYLCRIEAMSAIDSQVRIFKIMVIK